MQARLSIACRYHVEHFTFTGPHRFDNASCVLFVNVDLYTFEWFAFTPSISRTITSGLDTELKAFTSQVFNQD